MKRAKNLRLGMHLWCVKAAPSATSSHHLDRNAHNSANCSFATDDKLPGDLVNEGHIVIPSAKQSSTVGAITAVQMGTSIPRVLQIEKPRVIAPRFWADVIVLDDLKQFNVLQTYKKGKLVAENGRF